MENRISKFMFSEFERLNKEPLPEPKEKKFTNNQIQFIETMILGATIVSNKYGLNDSELIDCLELVVKQIRKDFEEFEGGLSENN